MAKKMTIEEMKERDKQLMLQHKELQDQIKKAEAAEREHAASDIVQACVEVAAKMPEDIRPELKEIPGLIRTMWTEYFLKRPEPSAGLLSE